MGDERETITVAESSDGPPKGETPGESVELPVVEILTGRGFVTGKSGSGKSNTASVVAEKLLDNGFGILIVDIDGEYYGLKEEYEILHVGADEECDIQVTVDHAEKIAALALEQNVPIILDVSSFLDEEEAQELLTEVSKQLFAKEKKLKQPFLMLVEEVHEYIPEKGSVGECGKMLIKIGKRGRKHGLGMVGISQRPADVKKDFITQCDWLVWHRLTWNNDTKVVSRILDSEYADAVEDLDDGEGFMMNDWSESVQRVQFHRKQTFDAGATPGLDDVDRPDLKSVSSDLVSELEEISEEKQRTEDRIQELREELDRKNSRIAELERELQDARDMSRMADQFVSALVDHVDGPNPGRTEQANMRTRRQRQQAYGSPDDAGAGDGNADDTAGAPTDLPGAGDPAAASGESTDAEPVDATASGSAGPDEAGAGTGDATASAGATDSPDPSDANGAAPDADDGPEAFVSAAAEAMTDGSETASGTGAASDDEDVAMALEGLADVPGDFEDPSADSSATDDAAPDGDPGVAVEWPDEETASGIAPEDREVVRDLVSAVRSMPAKTVGMLRYYRKEGPAKPLDAHFAGGGDGDRTNAYAHNRTLRTNGLIEHVGRGHYDYRLRDLLAEEYSGRPDAADLDAMVAAVERAFTN